MPIVSSREIVKTLLNVIESAQQEIVLVSPDACLLTIGHVEASLRLALTRGVIVHLYADGTHYNKSAAKTLADTLKIRVTLLQNLRACFYLNEQTALITSLQLGESEAVAMHIACQTQEPEQVSQLKNIIRHYNSYFNVPNPLEVKRVKFQDVLYHATLDEAFNFDEINFKPTGELELSALYPVFIRTESLTSKADNYMVLRSLINPEKAALFEQLSRDSLREIHFSVSVEEATDSNWYQPLGKLKYHCVKSIYSYPISSGDLNAIPHSEQRILAKAIVKFASYVKWYNQECANVLRPPQLDDEPDEVAWFDQ